MVEVKVITKKDMNLSEFREWALDGKKEPKYKFGDIVIVDGVHHTIIGLKWSWDRKDPLYQSMTIPKDGWRDGKPMQSNFYDSGNVTLLEV